MLKVNRVSALTGAFFIGAMVLLGGCETAPDSTASREPYTPDVKPASDEGLNAIKKFQIAPGFQIDLWAAEPLLANPVAIAPDDQGRWFVSETFRHTDGVLDIRGRMHWLDEELASASVEERIAIMERHLTADQIEDYTRESERLRLVADTDGDGRADHATIFAEGFDNLEDGIAAGVLARDGDVYFANLPDLWLLRDEDGDGRADFKKSLQHGYGVRVGFLGHDLHGLRMGPDGKLYFSMGDRGFNVKQGRRRIESPETGAVLRCDPDGSNLEIVHRGLRNPQELAFDNYGNLFTGDNNSDGGDQARWVYVVEGGDSGWRIGWQFINQPNARGPWMSEKMDEPWHDPTLQPAYIVPPLKNIASGPSGLTHYPGTGLPDEYENHFFLCDFRGSSSASGIHTFTMEPDGAAYRVTDLRPFMWNILCTDADFGIDGALYVSDWVEGWSKPGKGRLYRISHPTASGEALTAQTQRLISEGMRNRPSAELAQLLAFPDQRVRTEAQFELAERGEESVPLLAQAALRSENQLARLHGIWGLGQISAAQAGSRDKQDTLQPLFTLAEDSDPEIRAQAAKVLGDRRLASGYEKLVQLTSDGNRRVQFFALLGLGKLGRGDAIPAILAALRRAEEQDPYLRHAGVMALTWMDDESALVQAADDASPAVRMAVLLALRRMESPRIARFLEDPDARLVLEAARAINDLPITEALPELARLMGTEGPPALQRRILNANYRMGGEQQAEALVSFAVSDAHLESLRAEAIGMIGHWPEPPGRDGVTGLWRPVSKRLSAPAKNALQYHLTPLFNSPPAIQVAAIRAIQNLRLTAAAAVLYQKINTHETPAPVQVAALQALAELDDPRLIPALQTAAQSPHESLRNEATRLQAKADPAQALTQIETTLQSGSVAEKQNALETLGVISGERANALLAAWLGRLNNGEIPPELRLDVLEAAANKPSPEIQRLVQRYETNRDPEDLLRNYRESLAGGDPARGRSIFFERLDVFCSRCHLVDGQGGVAGPDLSKVGSQRSREYIMESILYPNKQIAEGFENVIVTLQNGTAYAGILGSESDDTLVLLSPEDGEITIAKSDIKSREKGQSGMPSELRQILSKSDVRDLVEYLSQLR